MTPELAIAVLSIVVSGFVAVYVGRLGAKSARESKRAAEAAEKAKQSAQEKKDAGELAVAIANDADERAKQAEASLRAFKTEMRAWWNGHDAWDRQVEQELYLLDPKARDRLPPRDPPPF